MQNPFKPTAGATPPDLIGRAGLLDEFEYGLQQGLGSARAPYHHYRIQGHRQDRHAERSGTDRQGLTAGP